jgi:uncharacterized protein
LNRKPLSPEEPISINDILYQTKTIAVIGCSSKPHRTSYRITGYLQNAGYRIIPVNPHELEVHGEKSYSSMNEIPDDLKIDLINIFRNRRHTPEMMRNILEWSEKTGNKPPVWTQPGVSSNESKNLALENGFTYIENRCIMVEHGRLE